MKQAVVTVRAVDGHRVPYVGADGRIWMGRFIGIKADGTAHPEGESVPASAYVFRAVQKGALALVQESLNHG